MIRQSVRPEEYGRWTRDLLDFASSGWDCAVVDLGGTSPQSVANAMRAALRRHPDVDDVRVAVVGDNLYLMRDGPDRESDGARSPKLIVRDSS